MAWVSARLLRAGGSSSPMAACPVCRGSRGPAQWPRSRTGPQGVIWSSPRSKPASGQVTSESVLAMQSQPSRKSRSCLPLPGHNHFFFFFFFRQQQSVYVATGTHKLQPPTEPRPPSLPRATSWHLKLRIAKHLINCPAASPRPALLPAPLSSLFSSLRFLPYPTYLQYKPTELQEAPILSKKAAPTTPVCPLLSGGRALLSQMPRASFAPEPASRAIPPHLYFTCIHIQTEAGRNQGGPSPLQQGFSPWPSTRWGGSSGRAVSSLSRSMPAAGIWVLVP